MRKPKITFHQHSINGGWGLEFGVSLGENQAIVNFGKHFARVTYPFPIRLFGVSEIQRRKAYGQDYKQRKAS